MTFVNVQIQIKLNYDTMQYRCISNEVDDKFVRIELAGSYSEVPIRFLTFARAA